VLVGADETRNHLNLTVGGYSNVVDERSLAKADMEFFRNLSEIEPSKKQ
jgi:hypothetical protein